MRKARAIQSFIGVLLIAVGVGFHAGIALGVVSAGLVLFVDTWRKT